MKTARIDSKIDHSSFRHQFSKISTKKKGITFSTPLSLLVIASYLNRLHFKETINNLLPWDHTQRKYSPGALAQLMVLLPFIPSRKKVALSRIHEAFSGMDLQLLVGESINPETLTDDIFANVLEGMYDYGCERLYNSIALTVRTVFNLPPNYILHSDTTSHILYGDYENSDETIMTEAIIPAYGVSKQKRNDLKQIMSGSVSDGDGLVMFCHILNGNTADCEYNHLMLSVLQSTYDKDFDNYTYIADCKLLTEKNLHQIYGYLNPVKFISCIPDNFCGKLSEKTRKQAYIDNKWDYLGICCNYPSGKKTEPEYWVQVYARELYDHQMWIHVYRKAEAERHLEQFLKEKREKFIEELTTITSKSFQCEPDAKAELNRFIKSQKSAFYSALLSIESVVIEKNPVGRPSKVSKPPIQQIIWNIKAEEIIDDIEKIERKKRKIDAFCLLTSIPPDQMNSREVLLHYKGQNVVESMFSLLKEPLLASVIYLEKPQRIEGLMTLLYFSVLMHGILQIITRMRIKECSEPPRIGNENRPLIRPKSNTILNILENFEILTVNNNIINIRSKQMKRREQLDLIIHLVDFDPGMI